MPYTLVIVESPAKAKTIEKFLGPDYKVLASFGHVRSLPSKPGSVNIGNNFEPYYKVRPESKKHIDTIKKALKNASALLLATDPDREGEAISWHLQAALGIDEHNSPIPIQRIAFHEITQKAISEAVRNPRAISIELVNAQQARSILDYLVGFNLSPFLWQKVRYNLSAGRVQSVALRLICDREKEIQAFRKQEYWTVTANLISGEGQCFTANLVEVYGNKLDKLAIPDEVAASKLVQTLIQPPYQVIRVVKAERKRFPAPPFTTSTLQQEASRKFGFSAKKTMATAQRLYDGIEIGEGAVGLITYMRTDSVALSTQALDEVKNLISNMYGQEFTLPKPRLFKNKVKNAQEAHEAIRPTYVDKKPAEIEKFLTTDEFKIYDLIWKRTVACQMAEALFDQTIVDIAAGQKSLFRANGSVLRFPGFMKAYIEGTDDDVEEKERLLPPLNEGDALELQRLLPEQHFTQPPPRYTEATLVKTLEEYGIGRPSTYASIISKLLEKNYARLEKKRFFPEDVGVVVSDLLAQHFTQYVDYNYTANLEELLDLVSRGEKPWQPLLKEFWEPFIDLLKRKEAELSREDVTSVKLDELCPECSKSLVVKLGKQGKFIACSGFKDGCRYTRNLTGSEQQEKAEPVLSEEKCSECGKPMLIMDGRYGKYLSCSGHPGCKNTKSLDKSKGTGVVCPECEQGELVEKKSRKGKVFYSCNRYPACKFLLWDRPVAKPCLKCDSPLLVKKVTKREGEFFKCPKAGCDFREPVGQLISE